MVDPGVIVEFTGKHALTVQGTLSAVGTASSLIVFTSAKASPAAGDWVGVHVSSTTLLRFVKISYADAGVWCEGPGNAARLEACTFTDNGSGIYLANQSTPVITRDAATSTGCTITKNQHGIYIALVGPNSIPQPDISYNSFLDNTTYDVYTQYYYDNSALTINARNNWWGTTDVGTIASHIHDYTDNAACPVVDFNGFLDKAGGAPSTVTLVSGRVLTAATWQASKSPYKVVGPVLVDSGASLVVDPGVIVEFTGKHALTVQGTLSAVGTASSLIVFTSAKASPAAGDWVGVHVSSTTLLRFVKISHADAGCVVRGSGKRSASGGLYVHRQRLWHLSGKPEHAGYNAGRGYEHGLYDHEKPAWDLHCARRSEQHVAAEYFLQFVSRQYDV